MTVSLRRAGVFVVGSLVLLVVGTVLPGVGSALAEREHDRAERQVSVECEPKFVAETETRTNGSGTVRTGLGSVENCREERRRAIQREQRDWITWAATALRVGGWALRLGGLVWLALALRAAYYAVVLQR